MVPSVFMFAVSNEETRLSGVDLHNWSSMKEAGWYCYGTVIGESITRDTKSEKAVSLRFVCWNIFLLERLIPE